MNEFDEAEYEKMSPEERRKVDEILERRHKAKRLKARIPAQILQEMEDEDDGEQILAARQRKYKKFYADGGDDDLSQNFDNLLDQENQKGNVLQWIQEPYGIRAIRKAFTKLIKEYSEIRDEDTIHVYENRIIEMCQNNRQSLEVNYEHLLSNCPNIAELVINYPDIVIPYLDDVAFELTSELFPNYPEIFKQIFVRIKDISANYNLRSLRCNHIGHLIKIKGVVTKRSVVYPKLKIAFFTCVKCGERNGPFNIGSSIQELNIGSCPVCQANGPYKKEQDLCIYRNYQRLVVQESPGTVPPGRVPRQKEIILTNDLVDKARPGDEVEITGIYKSLFDYSTNLKHSFPVFQTHIEANSIKRLNDIENTELTDEDKKDIRQLGKRTNITQLIFNSIAPSIYGHDFIKKALAISMFGGVPKDPQGKHKIRGDINVLLLGDPGTAKSQFLKYIQKVFNRSVYTTGKGASAVGLTAGVHKDPVTKEWTLEGGALVLADKGICLIDEFDKMNDQDRTSIHEAMEQQSISISKAGIVTSLQARCSVIAAANPIKGRYDNKLTFANNVELTDPILSRFDILCVVKDEVDPVIDDQLATFVINSHIVSHPEYLKNNNNLSALLEDKFKEEKETINQDLLKKYILYARKEIKPKINEINKNKISKFYSELRKESELAGGIRITVRHLESLLRIAESFAKMHLRETVVTEDINMAIQITLESFLQSQKFTIARGMRKKLAGYLILKNEHDQLLLNTLAKMAREQFQYLKYVNPNFDEEISTLKINKSAFEREVAEMGIHNLNDFYKSKTFIDKHIIDENDIVCYL